MALLLSGGVRVQPSEVKAVVPEALVLPEQKSESALQPYVAFDRTQHFTVGENDPMTERRVRTTEIKTAIKWGQLKLLLEEIQFLTLYWDPVKVPEPLLVYVGSAVGTHIPVLIGMFPKFTYHLYDPREHDPIFRTEPFRSNPKIRIHKQFFEDKDAQKYAGKDNVFLIVDIRGSEYLRKGEDILREVTEENEKIVWDNMLLQQAWTRIIRPVRASLKFRLPYVAEFTRALGTTRVYLDGLVYLQQWGSLSTTEARLVPYEDLRTREWDYEAHGMRMYYQDYNIREKLKFLNPLTNDRTPIAPLIGLTNDYDSTASTVIVMEYFMKFGLPITAKNVIAVLDAMILGANKGRTTLIGLRSGIKTLQLGSRQI